MFYVITTIFFLFWACFVIRKGHLSWHTIISIYLAAIYLSDIADELFDHFFNFYDLPARLLQNPYSDQYLGLVFSDAVLFPLLGIIFCYYSARYHRPWLLSIIFASLMGIIEFVFVKQGYMVYHHWNYWITPAITFMMFRILAYFADRFIYYSPPISYRFWLACLIYGVSELPGSFMGFGIMHLYQYRPHIFDNSIADDRFLELMHGYVLGAVGAYFAPKIRQQYKFFLFIGLGLCTVLYAFWMYEIGWLNYHRWNHVWTIIRYLTPYLLIYWYDCWESSYRSTIDYHNNQSKRG